MATCNQLGLTMGYDRGFDTIRVTTDYRTILEHRIARNLLYDLDRWRAGQVGEAETIERLQHEFGLLLDKLAEDTEAAHKGIWPSRLRAINDRVTFGAGAERALLSRAPQLVMRKLLRIPPAIYWRFLGEDEPGGLRLLFWRAVTSVEWRSRRFIAQHKFPPFLWLQQYPCLAGETVEPVAAFMSQDNDKPWFIYMHVMDVHDCRAINRFGNVLYRLKYFPRWMRARLKRLTRRHFVYDSTVMYVDECLGRLFGRLRESGRMDDIVIVATGDHGFFFAESPRGIKVELGFRTHYEDIEVPLLVYGADRPLANDGMIDSMGVTATFLEALGVPPHQSFKGKSAFSAGRPAVVSENCGSGNADVARRDIYFTVTSKTHKLMARLSGNQLNAEQLYDLRNDPREIRNIIDAPGMESAIEWHLGYLNDERADVLAMRGVTTSDAATG